MKRVIGWLEDRTGVETAVKTFLYEEIPASSGWKQVFGSVAAFLIMVQIFTGILLAFNYAPTPGEAYHSLKYLIAEVTGGQMIRGLHHWGASMIIVVVVLHMCQVFLYGAYKKPREVTWIIGVILLLLTFAYGLTGYLLPWDNRAYWGTVVATQIAAQAPGMGPYLSRLLGGEGAIGVVTFARFYAIHVLLLPPATMLLIGIHIYLVRKHGVAPEAKETGPKKMFYPEQVYKDTVAIFVAFVILFVLAIAAKVPLERMADPTDTSYIPRPEWYFLFLFQTLKFFEGPLEVVGSIVLPTIAIAALFALPFIDRGQMTKLRQRTLAMGVLALVAIGWAGLTAAAIATTPKMEQNSVVDIADAEEWQKLNVDEVAAIGFYKKANCSSCHAAGKSGPDLSAKAVQRDAAWVLAHIKQPNGDGQPGSGLSTMQAKALSKFALNQTPAKAKLIQDTPQFATDGAMIYQTQNCAVCHQINGAGMKTGPPLNGVGAHRTKTWLVQHFVDPGKMSKGTVMPAYKFNPKDMDAMTAFLLSLPTL